MKLGMIGLGRMGGNMARRLIAGGHEIVAYDRDPKAVDEARGHGATPATSLAEVAENLDSPATYWVMLPAGEITDNVMREIAAIAKPGDILIDGALDRGTGRNHHPGHARRVKLGTQVGQVLRAAGAYGDVLLHDL